ncbi:MAG TPA: polyhydroxyalkanoate synthesis regulator DNA-binding domain-containing protein [Woeseiaceae bacterium]|nr:polyhydroxyalkanoate synthesis regulator DNA-binding domain-containing protein [Woeseiaceae bacterium]
MSTRRVINKYPNRRLYDTEESRYITLADIRDLVLGEVEFVVIDKKDGRDITRCILLQVISEREQQEDPVLGRRFLLQVIRLSDGGGAAALSAHLEENLEAFLQHPSRTAKQPAPASNRVRTSVCHWKPQLPAERKKAG